jgi:S-adenosylmethionine:tRNA ribosyltransferase-isomerase
MNISEFKYNLPGHLIAQYPPKERGTTNLLILEKEDGTLKDKKYFNIPEYIKEGDVVVLNETKVIDSRTYFSTSQNKKVEVLFLEERGGDNWYVLIGRAKYVEKEDILVNEESDEIQISVLKREGNGFLVKFVKGNSYELFEKYGHTPLPPYMKREDEQSDHERYNTIFSKLPGAVAAPTASLNLTKKILKKIENKGAKLVKVELKVGWGTFAPIREENIEDHEIHEEYIHVSKESAERINEGILKGGRVWAFGTTVARTLESVAYKDDSSGRYLIKGFQGETNLYIYPGYEWKIIDCLMTNFHMPDSSLILLVSSFAGKDNIKKAYKHAIDKKYKFLSYGDSMLII